ncbi:MAG: hemolysin III family protein [Oscillospiraceae bacterium]|nr:hemolysin III family protein [Oscillospiraceae bacterium]
MDHNHSPIKPTRDPYDALRPWSSITHGIGILLAVVGTVLLLMRARSPLQFIAYGIYGASMTVLYTASTLYHCLRTGLAGRRLLRKFDHCSICLLIAGSYTPICLISLTSGCGHALLAAVWIFALLGILLSILWIGAPRWLSSAVYLCMGWLVVFVIVPVVRSLSPQGLFWLVLGGVMYSVGGVLYAVKWPGRNNPRFGCHEIFHVFILLGTVFQYFAIYGLV